jgi:hypothetical protein
VVEAPPFSCTRDDVEFPAPANGYAIVLVIVTAPVEPESEMPAPATLLVTPVLVILGATDPSTVKAEQETPDEQEAEDVADEYTEVPLPERRPPSVVEPVPPLPTPSAVAKVRTPAESKDDVAVPPK